MMDEDKEILDEELEPDPEPEVEDVPLPEPEPEPVVEDPKFSPQQVEQMVRAAITRAEKEREAAEFQRQMDELYEKDPASWARVERERKRLEEERLAARQDVATEYYKNIFGAILPKYGDIFQSMTMEEKRELHPDNPKYRSDDEYLQALLTKIAEKEAEMNFQAWVQDYQTNQQTVTEEAIRGEREAGNFPDLQPASPDESRGGNVDLKTALREVVGISNSFDDDYSD